MKKGFLFGLGILLSGVVLAAGIGVDDINGDGDTADAIEIKAETDTVSHGEFNGIIGALRNIFNLDGKIGIGESDPKANLHISHNTPLMMDLFKNPALRIHQVSSGTLPNQQGGIVLSREGDEKEVSILGSGESLTINSTPDAWGTRNSLINIAVEGVGIGTSMISSGEQALALDVEGPVGASHYCDQDGNNCVAAADLGTGGTSLPACEAGQIVSYNAGNTSWECDAKAPVPDEAVPGSTVCEFTGTAITAGTGEFYHEWATAECTNGLPGASCQGVLTQAAHEGNDQDWMVIGAGGDNKPNWDAIVDTTFTGGGIAWTNAAGADDGAKRIQATYFCGGGAGGGALDIQVVEEDYACNAGYQTVSCPEGHKVVGGGFRIEANCGSSTQRLMESGPVSDNAWSVYVFHARGKQYAVCAAGGSGGGSDPLADLNCAEGEAVVWGDLDGAGVGTDLGWMCGEASGGVGGTACSWESTLAETTIPAQNVYDNGATGMCRWSRGGSHLEYGYIAAATEDHGWNQPGVGVTADGDPLAYCKNFDEDGGWNGNISDAVGFEYYACQGGSGAGGGALDIQIVEEDYACNAGHQTVSCPEGHKVVGGGFRIEANCGSSTQRLMESGPVSDNAWSVYVFHARGKQYAVCAAGGSGGGSDPLADLNCAEGEAVVWGDLDGAGVGTDLGWMCGEASGGASIDYDRCVNFGAAISSKAGGSQEPTEAWNAQCPTNHVMVGIWDDNDAFRDIDDMKCCPLTAGGGASALPECTDGEYLQKVDGAWACAAAPSGSDADWSIDSNDVYKQEGTVTIGGASAGSDTKLKVSGGAVHAESGLIIPQNPTSAIKEKPGSLWFETP